MDQLWDFSGTVTRKYHINFNILYETVFMVHRLLFACAEALASNFHIARGLNADLCLPP